MKQGLYEGKPLETVVKLSPLILVQSQKHPLNAAARTKGNKPYLASKMCLLHNKPPFCKGGTVTTRYMVLYLFPIPSKYHLQ